MRTDLVIFDLDGTLLDTVGDLAVACNAMLARRGLPEHTYADYRGFVGNGILRLVERALPEELRSADYVAAARADFVAYYTAHIDLHTKPYAGIPELLDALTRKGARLAVASNKFQQGTEKLIRRFFPEVPFVAVLGQRPGGGVEARSGDCSGDSRPCRGFARAGALRGRFGHRHADGCCRRRAVGRGYLGIPFARGVDAGRGRCIDRSVGRVVELALNKSARKRKFPKKYLPLTGFSVGTVCV